MLTLQQVSFKPTSHGCIGEQYDVADCSIVKIEDEEGTFVYVGCSACHGKKRSYDRDYCRKCDKPTKNKHLFKVQVQLVDSSGVILVARVAQSVFEQMSSRTAVQFSELPKEKQVDTLKRFFKTNQKYNIKLRKLNHDTKGLAYVIDSMKLQNTQSHRAPEKRQESPEVLLLSSTSEEEDEDDKDGKDKSVTRSANAVAKSTKSPLVVAPSKLDFDLSEDGDEEDDDEEPVQRSFITGRTSKRVILDSSDEEEVPLNKSAVSEMPSPKKIPQTSDAPALSAADSRPLANCGGRLRPASQLGPQPLVQSQEEDMEDTNDKPTKTRKIFTPGFHTLAKRGSCFWPATIQKYSSAKVGEHLVKFFGLAKSEVRTEYELLRPSAWLQPDRMVQVSRFRGNAPASSRNREGRIVRVIGGCQVPKRYEVEFDITDDKKKMTKKKIAEFEFGSLGIDEKERVTGCFDFDSQEEYLGSEKMVLSDDSSRPSSSDTSTASPRRSTRKRNIAEVDADSTDPEADLSSFINDREDLIRTNSPVTVRNRSPSPSLSRSLSRGRNRSQSNDNGYVYEKMTQGEIVFVKWRHEKGYYVFYPATIKKKIAEDAWVVKWFGGWNENPTVEEQHIMRVADLMKVGQKATYMPELHQSYEDDGEICGVSGEGNKTTVDLDVSAAKGYVRKKLFGIPLKEIIVYAAKIKK